ncbi:MAG TPA: hypothetical protein P5134_05565 [Bacteroidales bacterium]|jgi:hypothetical protein|nr:hypothetical protein [Bacteroidales bacterium]HOF46462.1 hypothetical protein [Bacteroidales bacterium]HOS58159.1 hypothetical protein [Bacteroidales bacterium]HQA87252.1 hypothetical protein [Bacteroidales bacterium]HRR04924.1 hypothetical protein [Bacteroidales bacterium]
MKKTFNRIVFKEQGKVKALVEYYNALNIKVSRQTVSAALNGRSSSELAMRIRQQALKMGGKEVVWD